MSDPVAGEANPIWNMDVTRELVGQKYGALQLATLNPVLRSVNIRLAHARIHYNDFQYLIETNLDKPIQNGIPVWDLMSISDEDPFGPNNLFFITCEAHIYACVQAMHAIADNLAHITYYTLGWNLDKKPPLQNVSMTSVLERLRQMVPSFPGLLPIQRAFSDLSSHSQYRTLADANNHLKHHGGLPVRVLWDPTEGEPYRVVLSSFTRNEQSHPQREITDYLTATFAIMSETVVRVGCVLNDWLREKQ